MSNKIKAKPLLKLPRFGTDWRMRWWVGPSWGVLHRVAEISFDDDDRISGHGATACGRLLPLRMPGIFSRIGLKRCHLCCVAAGVPDGNGAPFNQGIDA